MRWQGLVFGISFAAVALSGVPHEAAAQTQQGTQAGQTQQVQPEGGMMGGRMMGGGMRSGGMMGGDPMHGGMRGQERGPIGTGMMMRMMFSLMDADGDGSISLQEFQMSAFSKAWIKTKMAGSRWKKCSLSWAEGLAGNSIECSRMAV